jgi:hypothetical protein
VAVIFILSPRETSGSELVWQTDGELIGHFPGALADRQHMRIPLEAHSYPSDVEAVHRKESATQVWL